MKKGRLDASGILPAMLKGAIHGGAIGVSLYFTGSSLTTVMTRVVEGEALNASLATAFSWLTFDIVSDYVFLSGQFNDTDLETYNKLFWTVTAIRILKGKVIDIAKTNLDNLLIRASNLQTKISTLTTSNIKELLLELRWELIIYIKKIGGIKSFEIPLNEDYLGKLAIKFRHTNNSWYNGNITVFEYFDNQGRLRYLIQSTVPSTQRHAERLAIEALEKKGIPLGNVKKIYSELEPCQLESGGIKGEGCKQMIMDKGIKAEIRFSYRYPGIGTDLDKKIIREASILQRELDFVKFK